MAKAQKLYWIGKGVFKVDGVLYGKGTKAGRAFPVAKVDKDTLKTVKTLGLVSDKPFEDDDSLVSIEQLNAKVKDLSVRLVEANKALEATECEKCKEVAEKIATLEAELEEATKPKE